MSPFQSNVRCVRESFLIGLSFLVLLLPLELFAHGDLHEQIAIATKLIQKEPRNAALYLKRGELHRAHGDWDAAMADYDRSRELDPQLAVVDLARGKALLAANWPISAKVALDRYLATHTNHVDALVTRARVLDKLGEHEAAAQDFTAAILHSSAPQPEFYIERSQTLAAAGAAHLAEAVHSLDEGIKKLGPLVTLQLYAIDLEIKQKRFDAALGRLDLITAQSPRKETWLAKRGEILQQAGRVAAAREAYQSALKAIESLPASRRQVPAVVELEKRLSSLLKEQALAADKGAKGIKK
jgi:tetratricopeptide (TPR) repeat protein